jgi:hypothetical protein
LDRWLCLSSFDGIEKDHLNISGYLLEGNTRRLPLGLIIVRAFFTHQIPNMKHLQVNDMETVRGGSWACLESGLSAMGLFAETGVGALLAGVIVYSSCSLFS